MTGGAGGVPPNIADIDRGTTGRSPGGLDLPELEQGRGILGGQLIAARRRLPALHQVRRDIGQQGQGIPGRYRLEAGLHLVGNGFDLFDQDQVLQDVLGLRRRGPAGPRGPGPRRR